MHETSLYRTPGPWTGASDEAEWTNDKKEKLINNNSIDATEGTMVLYRWKSWFSGIHEAAVFTENVDQAPGQNSHYKMSSRDTPANLRLYNYIFSLSFSLECEINTN